MGTSMHPMEGVIVDLTVIRRQMQEEYIQDDGVICEKEQAVLREFDNAAAVIKHVRAVERASDLYMRQGPTGLTDYAKQQWNLAGLEVKPWEPDAA